MVDNHLDRKLDLIAEMLRCIYLTIEMKGSSYYKKEFLKASDQYTSIMTDLNIKSLGASFGKTA